MLVRSALLDKFVKYYTFYKYLIADKIAITVLVEKNYLNERTHVSGFGLNNRRHREEKTRFQT